MTADLYFGLTHQPCGFTSSAVAQFDGSAGPVVRELIQNCLDAARDASRVAEVRFVITSVPQDEIPGWAAYERTFVAAKLERRKWTEGKPSHDEKMVVDRISEAMAQSKIPVLLCIDNGHGLNGKRMDSLLTPGNTSKGAQGAGSFGLGHHAAFGASDLRYVLYAAKYRAGSENGEPTTIASGHTILASHRDADKKLRAADGYWFESGREQSAFNDSYDCYPAVAPGLLEPYLNELEDTGTVVCIAGFNDFHRDEDDPEPAEWIGRVAAANFSAAICSGALTVVVEDKRKGLTQPVEKGSLDRILAPISQQKRSQGGQIRGELAFNAWRTITEGYPVDLPDDSRLHGTNVKVRLLGEDEAPNTRVHVFRRGMWISTGMDRLDRKDFSKTFPFDAVLMLDPEMHDSGKLAELVRHAEGPEHRGVDMKRLDNSDKKLLRELAAEVAQSLRSEVGERSDVSEFTPTGFATIEGHQVREAERAPRARPPAGGGERKGPVTSGDDETNGDKKKPRRQGRPRSGSTPRYRASLRASRETSTIEAQMMFDETVINEGKIGVRVRLASGSDGTCEQPLPDSWVRLKKVVRGDGARIEAKDGEGDFELVLPAASGEQVLTITLAESVAQPELLELDVVKRKPASEEEDKG